VTTRWNLRSRKEYPRGETPSFMNSGTLLWRRFRTVLRPCLFSALIFTGSLSATELLIEEHQGGPQQYGGTYGWAHAASFELNEAVQIQGIQGWMAASKEFPPIVSISRHLPLDPFASDATDLFSQTLSIKGIAPVPPSHHVPPARWEGVSSLQWNLQPGTYDVIFLGGFFPYSYGYDGPPSTALGGPEAYFVYGNDGWQDNDGRFGVRIYGAPLSAIPEVPTYGLFGSAVLIGLVSYRRFARRVLANKFQTATCAYGRGDEGVA
jgi:hypothetical protein